MVFCGPACTSGSGRDAQLASSTATADAMTLAMFKSFSSKRDWLVQGS
jgi:hypothetical protein